MDTLTAVLPECQWLQLAAAIERILKAGHGEVSLAISNGHPAFIHERVSNRCVYPGEKYSPIDHEPIPRLHNQTVSNVRPEG